MNSSLLGFGDDKPFVGDLLGFSGPLLWCVCQFQSLIVNTFRGASHYGRPNREAEEVSGQTLLRVQRNGLKIGNKIFIFKHA